MNRTLLGALALAALSGCSQFENKGIFYVNMPVLENFECDTTITENIVDSDAPVGDAPTTEWTFDNESTRTPSALFMQVFSDRNGAAIVQIGNDTYLGTDEKGVIKVSWEGSTDDSYTETNSGASYTYTENEESTSRVEITLTENKDTKGYTGNWQINSDTTLHFVETDRWIPGDVGFNDGSINTAIFLNLEGTGSNSAEQDDCDSDPCVIDKVETCAGSVGFSAIETDLPDEAFLSVQNAGQGSGA